MEDIKDSITRLLSLGEKGSPGFLAKTTQRLGAPHPPARRVTHGCLAQWGLQCNGPPYLCGAAVLGGEIKGSGQETQCILRRTFSMSHRVQMTCPVPTPRPQKADWCADLLGVPEMRQFRNLRRQLVGCLPPTPSRLSCPLPCKTQRADRPLRGGG